MSLENATKRLGKHPKKLDRRNLQMARYIPRLVRPPPAVDHASEMPSNIGMMGNDDWGDCTVAAAGHMVQSWSVYASGKATTIDEDTIISTYLQLSPRDEGAYMLDVLNYWRKNGVGGDKIEAFVEVAAGDLNQAKLAIHHFGSLYIGLSLPDENLYGPWLTPTGKANPYNGHAVCLIAYNDKKRIFKVCTWGEIWDMSYDWYQRYCEESYACLNDISLLKSTGKSPEGFDWDSLQRDLSHIGDPITDPPQPSPAPPPVPPKPIPWWQRLWNWIKNIFS